MEMKHQLLDRWIDERKQQMIRTLQALIEIPSTMQAPQPGMPFGAPVARALEIALAAARELGLTTTNHDFFMGAAEVGPMPPGLGILCHLDVVPADGDGWHTPPFTGTVADGKIYGRGAIDDKGPAVAALFALGAVAGCGLPLKNGVRLLFGCNEENGSHDLAHYRTVEPMPPMLFTPDADFPVINIEKGMLRAHITARFTQEGSIVSAWARGAANAVPGEACALLKGFSQEQLREAAGPLAPCGVEINTCAQEGGVLLKVTGKGAHASTPHEGVNALTALLAILSGLPLPSCAALCAVRDLSSFFPHGLTGGEKAGLACADGKSGRLTCSLDLLEMRQGTLDATVDIRFPLCRSKAQVFSALSRGAAACGLIVQEELGYEPHHVDQDSALVKTLLKAYTQQTGKEGYCMPLGGGTYVHGIPGGVAFGPVFPGENNHLHGDNEFIGVEQLYTCAKLYAHAIAELCAQEGV